MSTTGALVGAAAGVGVILVCRGALARRPLGIADRVSPYLLGPSAVADSRDDLGTSLDSSTLARILQPSLRQVARRLDGFLGGSDALQRRLISAGQAAASPASFRLSQLTWAVVGMCGAGLLLVLVAALGGPVRPAASSVLAVVCGLAGALLRDYDLSRAVRRRREAIRYGLPPVADLLALAVASGESPADALDRVARVARGPLADECRRACSDTASGVSFVDALDSMAGRIDVPAVRRFVDGVAIAVQRGTPLAEVLRAQSGDARADLHRSLLEVAGRKELLMMMPVVFLVLPTVVLVALYPALTSLTSIAP